MATEQPEGTAIFQDATDTVFGYKARTATHGHAAGPVMGLARCRRYVIK